jgi:hypothetical protein
MNLLSNRQALAIYARASMFDDEKLECRVRAQAAKVPLPGISPSQLRDIPTTSLCDLAGDTSMASSASANDPIYV